MNCDGASMRRIPSKILRAFFVVGFERFFMRSLKASYALSWLSASCDSRTWNFASLLRGVSLYPRGICALYDNSNAIRSVLSSAGMRECAKNSFIRGALRIYSFDFDVAALVDIFLSLR